MLPGAVFEVVVQALVLRGAPGPGDQVRRNLMKLGIEDTAGVRQSYRDTLTLSVTPPPPLRVVKGVKSVDVPGSGPNGPNSNIDGVAVQGGSVATSGSTSTTTAPRAAPTARPSAASTCGTSWPGPGLLDGVERAVRPAPATAPTVTCTDPGSPDQPDFHRLVRVEPAAGDVGWPATSPPTRSPRASGSPSSTT